jgi:hypothetical protein
MSDIVERLRICAKFDPDQAEAADEIEKLRAALKGAEAWLDRWASHVGSCVFVPETCTCGRDFVLRECREALGEKE